MRNNIQNSFSIKDLENLSGIKAHTIRIWEKRYSLLTPNRSTTNIRRYDTHNLKRLLNVVLLNKSGVKISKIGGLSEEEITAKVQDFIIAKNTVTYSYDMLKLAMLNFDQALFNNTYNKLLQESSFREVFLNVFVKLLEEIGFLWQTNTILPIHENFISNLIKQKVLINTEKVQEAHREDEKTFVLFLPENEIHELGLLYMNFELSLKGHNVVFLGSSVQVDDLLVIQQSFKSTEFISFFTVEPTVEKLDDYLSEINTKVLTSRKETLHIIGRNTTTYDKHNNLIISHTGLHELITYLNK